MADAAPIRARRSMAAAPFCGAIYLFGGVGGAGTESILDIDAELWRFDPALGKWERLGPEGGARWPEARRCCGFTATADGLLMWGGSGVRAATYTFLNDLWRFDTNDRTWSQLEGSEAVGPNDCRPVQRYTAVLQIVGGRVVLFGGYTEDVLGKRKMNDLWIRDCASSSWGAVRPRNAREGYDATATYPGVRYGAMHATDGSRLYICGGSADEGDHIDVWAWDAVSGEWDQLCSDGDENRPTRRYCGAAAYYGGGLWLFGGRSRHHARRNFNDTWRFDLGRRRWELVDAQCDVHRYDHGADHIGYHAKASAAVVGSRWYLWGGEGRHGHVSDLWVFDFDVAKWSQIAAARADDPVFW